MSYCFMRFQSAFRVLAAGNNSSSPGNAENNCIDGDNVYDDKQQDMLIKL